MPSAPLKPVVFGLSGPQLTPEERAFFAEHNPLGFILFARNIQNLDQVARLCAELRMAVNNPQAFIFIDQEGGRVQRIKEPLLPNYPSMRELVSQARGDEGFIAAHFKKLGTDLSKLGINVDCAPVLDVPIPGSHDVIGDRAFGVHADDIIKYAAAAVKGLNQAKVFPVIKHIPGHGRAMVDSHLELPIVDTHLDELRKTDFAPFKALNDAPFAMTAHVVYRAIDPHLCATLSPKVIALIRQEIGFQGLLLTDDLGMKALKGDFAGLAHASLEAGCDIVLHCSGKMEEMLQVAKGLPTSLSPVTQARLAKLGLSSYK
ncbi:MAG: beta-N-acetylhexosaminidase [Dongiaceae bacterium]